MLVLAEPGETLEPAHFSEQIAHTLELVEASWDGRESVPKGGVAAQPAARLQVRDPVSFSLRAPQVWAIECRKVRETTL